MLGVPMGNATAEHRRAYRERHPERAKEQTRRWRAANPEKVAAAQRRRELRRRYNMTPEQYDELSDAQGGVCAVCGSAPVTDVDHDHDTGEVRGLLCGPCNRGLGQFRDDVEAMAHAIAYINAWRAH